LPRLEGSYLADDDHSDDVVAARVEECVQTHREKIFLAKKKSDFLFPVLRVGLRVTESRVDGLEQTTV
jgi:hypothetical protein